MSIFTLRIGLHRIFPRSYSTYSDLEPIIVDELYGQIKLPNVLNKIINTREFQRLKSIKQCGPSHYIYMCMTHSRFEHSIGTAYLSGLVASHLKLPEPDKINVQIAALCHDLGHGPYSHTFEHVLKKLNINKGHEDFTKIMINFINEKYKLFNTDAVIDILFNKSNIYYPLISASSPNEIDIDRMDYLLRDLRKIGPIDKNVVDLSIEDFNKIIYNISILNNTITGLSLENKFSTDLSKRSIENVINTRNYMYKNVYYNKEIKIIEQEIINDLASDLSHLTSKEIMNPGFYMHLTDNIISETKYKNFVSRN